MIKQFFKPTSLEEAMLLKEKYGQSVTWFAGGAYFNHISFHARYEKVIGLEGLGLHAVHTKRDQISIGATVTLQKLTDNSLVPKPLRRAAAQAATRTIRNMATIGGDIAVGGQKTRLAPCLIALEATVVTSSKENMSVENYLESGCRDLILKITLPEKNHTCYINQFTHKANAPAVIDAAVCMNNTTDTKANGAIVAIGSIEETPRRLKKVEELIMADSKLEPETISKIVSDCIQPTDDILGSADFKKYIAGQTVTECIMNCLEGR